MRLTFMLLVVLVLGAGINTAPAQTFSEEPEIATNVDLSTWRISSGADVGSELGGTEGKLRFFCTHSHLAYNDPIINFGAPGASHLHEFYGNTLTSAVSTYETLRRTGGGTCAGGPANRTGYWIPAMINGRTNTVVKPRMFEFYYQVPPTQRYLTQTVPGEFTSPNCPPPPAIACPTYAPQMTGIPKGLKLVAGVNPTTGLPRSGSTVLWRCVNSLGTSKVGEPINAVVFYDPITPANGLNGCTTSDDGNATNTYMLNLVITFPVCWNGDLDSANHSDHIIGTINDQAGSAVCPTTHPIFFPSVIAFVYWDHSGPDDFKDWYLSSDRYNGATWRPGETAHADAYWAWDPDVMRTIVEYIWALDGVQQNRTTNNGVLGDGTKLTEAHFSMAFLSAAARELAMPMRGGAKGKIRARVR